MSSFAIVCIKFEYLAVWIVFCYGKNCILILPIPTLLLFTELTMTEERLENITDKYHNMTQDNHKNEQEGHTTDHDECKTKRIKRLDYKGKMILAPMVKGCCIV